MTRTFCTPGLHLFARTFSILSFNLLARFSLARGILNRAVAARGISLVTGSRVSAKQLGPTQDFGCVDEHRALSKHSCFSDVWKDAQRSRTAFARAYVKALMRRVCRAGNLAQADLGIAPRAEPLPRDKPSAPSNIKRDVSHEDALVFRETTVMAWARMARSGDTSRCA